MPHPAAAQATDQDQPSWNKSPITLPAFNQKLHEWVPRQDSDFPSLIEEYTISYRTLTVVASATHARLRKTNRLPTDRSCKEPADTTYPLKPELVPSIPVTPAATPGTPGSTADATATPADRIDYSHKLTPEEALQYIIAPDMLAKKDAELYDTIVKCIPSKIARDQYLKLCGRSGLSLLRTLHLEEVRRRGDKSQQSAEQKMQAMQDEGLADATVQALLDYREPYESYNNTLAEPIKPSVLQSIKMCLYRSGKRRFT